MGIATRRSEIACGRMGYNPLVHPICRGVTIDRRPCEREVLLAYREIAYYMVGHGAHLFSDSGELRGILTEAADLLYCCADHRASDDLVRIWIEHWKNKEKTDRDINDLIQARIREHGSPDRKWQAAFENSIGQIVRSDLSDTERIKQVRWFIDDDRFHERRNLHSTRTAAGRFGLKVRIPQPEGLRLSDASNYRTRDTATPLSPLPSSLPGSGSAFTSPEEAGWSEITPFPHTASAIVTQDARPILRAAANIAAPKASHSSTSQHSQAEQLPEVGRFRSRSGAMGGRQSFSEMGTSFFRAVTQRFSPSVSASSASATTSPLQMSPLQLSAQQPLVSSTRNLQATVVDEEDEEKYVADPQSGSKLEASKLYHATLPMTRSRPQAVPMPGPCDVCTLPLDRSKPRTVWKCPDCANEIHMGCLQEWNLEMIRNFRQPTCPYCRSVITRPANF